MRSLIITCALLVSAHLAIGATQDPPRDSVFTDLTVRVDDLNQKTDELLNVIEATSLGHASAKFRISDNLFFICESDQRIESQRICSVELLVGKTQESAEIVKVPVGVEKFTQFILAVREADKAGQGERFPWTVGYKVKSSIGGEFDVAFIYDQYKFKYARRMVRFRFSAPERSTLPETFAKPVTLFEPEERLYFEIPLTASVYPAGTLFWDELAGNNPTLISMFRMIKSISHDWYDLFVGVKDVGQSAQVTVNLKLGDRVVPMVRIPASFDYVGQFILLANQLYESNELEELLDGSTHYKYYQPKTNGIVDLLIKRVDGDLVAYHDMQSMPFFLRFDTPTPPAGANYSKLGHPGGRMNNGRRDPHCSLGQPDCLNLKIRFAGSPELVKVLGASNVDIVGGVFDFGGKPFDINWGGWTKLMESIRMPANVKITKYTVALKNFKMSTEYSEASPAPTGLKSGWYAMIFFADMNHNGTYEIGEPFYKSKLPTLLLQDNQVKEIYFK